MSECSLVARAGANRKRDARLIIIVGRNELLMIKISAFAQLEGARDLIEQFTD